jgi:hypothetical protein
VPTAFTESTREVVRETAAGRGYDIPLLYCAEAQIYFVKIFVVRDCRRGCLLEIPRLRLY